MPTTTIGGVSRIVTASTISFLFISARATAVRAFFLVSASIYLIPDDPLRERCASCPLCSPRRLSGGAASTGRRVERF